MSSCDTYTYMCIYVYICNYLRNNAERGSIIPFVFFFSLWNAHPHHILPSRIITLGQNDAWTYNRFGHPSSHVTSVACPRYTRPVRPCRVSRATNPLQPIDRSINRVTRSSFTFSIKPALFLFIDLLCKMRSRGESFLGKVYRHRRCKGGNLRYWPYFRIIRDRLYTSKEITVYNQREL